MNDYPRLIIDKAKLLHNIQKVCHTCKAHGISVSCVVKGFNGLPELVRLYDQTDCLHIADSRLDRLQQYKQMGIQKPLMLVRIPMPCEASNVVRYCDISLNSDIHTLRALNACAATYNVNHGVLLMADLGDLREGIFDEEEMIQTAETVEKELEHITLEGIGTNLGCYGAVVPNEQNTGQLVQLARRIEERLGRSLNIISAGSSTTLPLVWDNHMPAGANNLRIGEGIILAQDLEKLWNYPTPDYVQDIFTLEAQVIEVRQKPSRPIGQIFVNAFGSKPEFKDKGIRKRALLGLGKLDVGGTVNLLPTLPGIEILGGSSDHVILDIQDCEVPIQTGDILRFHLMYESLLFASASPFIKKVLI